MKRLFLFIGLLLSIGNLYSQEKVELKKSTRDISSVYLKLDFANTIEIKNWNKNELYIEAMVNLNQNKENDSYSLKSNRSDGELKITSDYGDFFKKHHKKVTVTPDSKDCNSYNYYTNHNSAIINYVIYVPQNMKLKIKSISGSVNAASYNGLLQLDLISGNITIEKYSTDLDLKTISGEIDIFVSDAKFRAETLTGTVYSNLDIDFSKQQKGFGHKIHGTVKSGKLKLKLKSISGDIFLRKPKL